MGRRHNSKCFNGGCRYGSCVCGGRHCEEYILVKLVGNFVDNQLVR